MRRRRSLPLLMLSGTAALLISAACSSEAPAPAPDAGGSSAQPDGSGGTPYAPTGDPDASTGGGSYDAQFDRCGKNCAPM